MADTDGLGGTYIFSVHPRYGTTLLDLGTTAAMDRCPPIEGKLKSCKLEFFKRIGYGQRLWFPLVSLQFEYCSPFIYLKVYDKLEIFSNLTCLAKKITSDET